MRPEVRKRKAYYCFFIAFFPPGGIMRPVYD
jgi:hypothetical protein